MGGDCECFGTFNKEAEVPTLSRRLPDNVKADQGETIVIKGKLEGSPLPKVQW